jgi:hypothetical protein
MAKLEDKMREDLELRGSRPDTIATYLRCVRRFFKHIDRRPAATGATEIRASLLYLIRERIGMLGTWAGSNRLGGRVA